MTKTMMIATCLVLALAGCGGGSDPAPTLSSAAGIWTGTDSATGLGVTALITQGGGVTAIRQDNSVFYGPLAVNGATLTGAIAGSANAGSVFPDGSIHGTGTVTLTVQPKQHISASVQFTTDAGETTTSNLALSYNAIYDEKPSMSAIAGTYVDSVTGSTVSIDSGGIVFGQDPATGCTVNGRILLGYTDFSVYQEQLTVDNCTGPASTVNGMQFDGLGTFNVDTTPATALLGLYGQDNSRPYAFVLRLTRQ